MNWSSHLGKAFLVVLINNTVCAGLWGLQRGLLLCHLTKLSEQPEGTVALVSLIKELRLKRLRR